MPKNVSWEHRFQVGKCKKKKRKIQKILPDVLGLGLWATLALCLKEFAVFSSSTKTEDSLTVPSIEEGEDDAKRKTCFVFWVFLFFFHTTIQVEVNLFVYLLGSPCFLVLWLARPCSVWGLLVWDQLSSPEFVLKVETGWKSSGMLPAAAATAASVLACAWAPLRNRSLNAFRHHRPNLYDLWVCFWFFFWEVKKQTL